MLLTDKPGPWRKVYTHCDLQSWCNPAARSQGLIFTQGPLNKRSLKQHIPIYFETWRSLTLTGAPGVVSGWKGNERAKAKLPLRVMITIIK